MPYKDKDRQREYQREWKDARRKKWFKENGPCLKCGSWDSLQIDHRDPSQKVSNSIWSWSKERRDMELDKCDILCSECHRKKTEKNLESGYKISISNVKIIRKMNSNGISERKIAAKFGVSKSQIHYIVTRECRANIS